MKINRYLDIFSIFHHEGSFSMYLNFSERRKSELIMLYWKRVMRSKSNIGFAFDTERHQQHLKCTQTLYKAFSSQKVLNV